MEVDTGAALSVISGNDQEILVPRPPSTPFEHDLRTYTDKPVQVIGNLHVKVDPDSELGRRV